MPVHVAGVIRDLLYQAEVPAKDARVLLMGWSYKAEVGDPRETPAEPLADALLEKGVHVGAWDPHLDEPLMDGVTVHASIEDAEGYDLVVLVTAHKACLEADWEALRSRMRTPMVYDGRRVLDLDLLKTIGWQVHAVGRP
jgi:UDP-N-acetyl-D-mannosaminuronate dehydrogenase